MFQLNSAIFSASYDTTETYDAYEKDIAMVTFYFESDSVFEYTRLVRVCKNKAIVSSLT